jgi:hypothetical protein
VLEGGAVPVAASPAEELELVTVVAAAILVVVREEDHPSHASLLILAVGKGRL